MVETLLERARKARKDESGFTLIELLIVIVILGILAGIVVFSVQGITDRGQTSACKADVATVQVASEAYYAKNGTYAADMTALSTGQNIFLQKVPGDVSYVSNGANTAPTITGTAPGC